MRSGSLLQWEYSSDKVLNYKQPLHAYIKGMLYTVYKAFVLLQGNKEVKEQVSVP